MNGRERARVAVQAALVLGALLSMHFGLQWLEDEPRDALVASDALHASVLAPVQHPRGPWQEHDTFTAHAAGIPLDVAPDWTVSAQYRGTNVVLDDPRWHAQVIMEETDAKGRTWWSKAVPLPVDAEGATAQVSFDAQRWVQEAHVAAEAADAPGRLELVLRLDVQGNVSLDGAERPVSRTTFIRIAPQADMALVQIEPGTGDFRAKMSKEPPVAALASFSLLGASVVAFGAMRRKRQPFENDILVSGLVVPAGTSEATLADLRALARRRGMALLVDLERRVALLHGDVRMAARWDDPKPKATRPEGPTEDA